MTLTSNSKWHKKLNSMKFESPVSCPYGCDLTFSTSLLLCRHVLSKHNWNKDVQEIIQEGEKQ